MSKYTEDHEWLSAEADVATIGITQQAAEQLGDLVFVDLPEIGLVLDKGDTAATVESVRELQRSTVRQPARSRTSTIQSATSPP